MQCCLINEMMIDGILILYIIFTINQNNNPKPTCPQSVSTTRGMKEESAMLLAWKPTHCTFSQLFSYNPSIAICWKGCDYAVGRVNDPKGRDEAQRMCKRFTTESMFTRSDELDNIKDLRVFSEMFPTRPENIYRACLSGIRRQKH